MKYWVFIFIFLVGCTKDTLHAVCPSECWPADIQKNKRGVGPCVSGVPVCNDDNHLIDCEYDIWALGIQLYGDKCDGIDNDCDGNIDNGFYPTTSSRWWDSLGENPCPSNRGVCFGAQIECVDGEFNCILPNTYELEETSCDGLDNDCDYQIDELSPRSLCFDDEFWKATNGNCKAGLEQCTQGKWACEGQILPGPELCDGEDNDCNGIIDDTGDTLLSAFDIVFVIDTSGSMCNYIYAVAGALDAYVEQFENNTNFRFAIVNMSHQYSDLVIVDTNFTDIAAIRSRLLALDCTGAGSEASFDSIQMVCNSGNPLGLSWREDATRMLFAFSDEEGQTFTTIPTTTQNCIDTCVASGTLPFIWQLDNDLASIADGANGIWFTLVDNLQQIFNDMNTVIITLCGLG